jgi:hypothetical protein
MTTPLPAPRTFETRIPIGRDHVLRLVERPAHALDAGALESLVAEMRDVADRCLPGGRLRYGVLSGRLERLERAVIAVVYDRRRVVGFSAMSWLVVEVGGRPETVLHAGLCMVVPGARRSGLSGILCSAPALLAFARNRFTPLWVTNVTQVPAVAGLFQSAAGDVYPAPGCSESPPARHAHIAQAVMARERHVFGVGDDAEFDAERFVIRNAYTGGSDELKKSWARADKHRDPRVNELCRDLLDYERGDDLLQVGRLNVGVVVRLGAALLARVARRATQEVLSVSGPTPSSAARRARSLS